MSYRYPGSNPRPAPFTALRANNSRLGLQSDQASRPIGSRVGHGDAPADGTLISYRTISDACGHPLHQATAWIWYSPILDLGMCHCSADHHVIAAIFDLPESTQAPNIHEHTDGGHAQSEQRKQ